MARIKREVIGAHLGDFNNPHQVVASQVEMEQIGTPTFSSTQHMQDIFHSTGWVKGGEITDLGGGSIRVALGSGLVRQSTDPTTTLYYFDWAQADFAIPVGEARYVGVQYISGTEGVPVVRTAQDWDLQTVFPLGSVVNEGGVLHIETSKQAVGDHAGAMIQRLLETVTVARDNLGGGLILGETGVRNVTMTAGALWKRLERFSIATVDTSGADAFDRYYRDGAGGFTKESAQTQWPNTQYDDGSGALQTLGNNRYSVLWFYIELDGNLVMLYGRGSYNSATTAEQEPPPSDIPLRLETHGTLLGRFVFQRDATSATEIQGVYETTFAVVPITNHAELSNLTIGDDHTQYQLRSEQGVADGYPSLDATVKIPTSQMPNGLVYGPSSSTDATIALYDGATGGLLKNSSVAIDSNSNIATSGVVQVGGVGATPPAAGMMQWTGSNFQGFTGSAWVDLDASGGGVPGGGDTQLQYNSSGSFSGIAGVTYNGTDLIIDSSVGFIPSGTGSDSCQVGSGADASGASGTAIGTNSTASGTACTAVGFRAEATILESVALGFFASATNSYVISIGARSSSTVSGGIAIGYQSVAKGGVAIGQGAVNNGASSVTIGWLAVTTLGTNSSITIGYAAKSVAGGGISIGAVSDVLSGHFSSIAFGYGAQTTAPYRCTIGTIGGGDDLELQIGKGFGMHGVTPPAQAAHIPDPTDLASSLTAIAAINVVLESMGAVALV
jgi:hypothetical protein